MRLFPRILTSIASGSVIGLLTFIATVNLILLTDPCDRRVHVCDIAPIVGFGIGVVVGPVVALIAAATIYWRLRPRSQSARSHDA